MSARAVDPFPIPQSQRVVVVVIVFLIAAGVSLLVPNRGWTWLVLVGGFPVFVLFRLLRAPLTQFEMVRMARRGRFVVIRALFAAIMLVVLYLVYANWFHVSPITVLANLKTDSAIASNQQARFAQSFYLSFLIAQYVILMLLTPAFVAGALVEERERGTLQYLLTTNLGDGEIVVSKLIARTVSLLLILLTGIPILALLQLLGGVDLAYLVLCLVLTFCNVVSVASLCLWLSTFTQRTRGGVGLGYLVMFGYHFCFMYVGYGALEAKSLSSHPVVITLFQVGNAPGALSALNDVALSGSLDDLLPWLLGGYLGFHALLAGFLIFLTYRRLRKMTFPDVYLLDLDLVEFETKRAQRRRPNLGKLPPILWKELLTGRDILAKIADWDFGSMGFACGMVFAGCMAVLILPLAMLQDVIKRDEFEFIRTMVVDFCIPSIACIVLLWHALRAATTISSERDQQTLDSLLATQLSSKTILSGKWQACLGTGWKAALVIGSYLLLGLILGGVHPLGLPLAIFAMVAHMVFVINLGMYCSTVCSTSGRATAVTIVSWLSITLGHWFLFLVCSVAGTMTGRRDLIDSLAMFHAQGLTPPLTFTELASLRGPPDRILAALGGTNLYLLAALILWTRTRSRFARLAGRKD
jgi:ABC-type transport system involved in multi-copper enzyme maturation permease subunit